MKFDSKLRTSILQYIFFIIKKPTFYHFVVVAKRDFKIIQCKYEIKVSLPSEVAPW